MDSRELSEKEKRSFAKKSYFNSGGLKETIC